MKKIELRRIFAFFAFIVFVVLIGRAIESEKARYYFLQGGVEAANKNMESAYEYFKKAYELDPEYKDAAFTYGNQRLFVRTDTLQSEAELLRSLRLMQQYVDENPKDVYAVQLYGYLTTALDTIDESIRVYERTYELMPTETQLLSVLADSYMRSGHGRKAIETLNRYEGIEGKSNEMSLRKITIMMNERDTLSAVQEVESLVSSNPRDPYSRILKGNLYEAIGKMDSVFKAYKDAERLAPDNGAVKMSLANYYRAMGDSVMLDNMIYEALLSEEFELQDKLGILGDYLQKLLEESGNKARGDHLFSVLMEQYPHEPDVLDMSARYSAAKGDFEGALETIGYAIDMDPTNERYWLMLMSYDLTEQKYEDAVKNYKRAIEHLEPSSQLKNLYAMAASMLENYEEGEKVLRSLLKDEGLESGEEINPSYDLKLKRDSLDYEGLVWISSLYCMLGDLYYKKGEPKQAFEEYENSLYFLADNALTLNNYAYFLSEEDMHLEKAKMMSKHAMELVENNPTYLDTYAWILYKLGDYKEAMEYIKKALELAEEQGDENDEYQKHYEAISTKLGD
ncbi:MAG: tetratricopeptide repeat protein [Muribaculaceae bacterium]|nr:tetratricopeptide repeat protein [Muribaculaceae bacterium]